MEQSHAEWRRAIFRTLWFRWPCLLDPLQPLRAFTFVQPPEVQELTVSLQGGIKLMVTAFQWETDTLSLTSIWGNSNRTVRFSMLLFGRLTGFILFMLSVINYIFSVYSSAPLNNSASLTFFLFIPAPFTWRGETLLARLFFMCRIFSCGSEVFLTLGDNV